jgi:hypothetical protein
MDELPKVFIRLNADGGLVDVEVEGEARPTELVEEREAKPTASFGDHTIKRHWLAPG